MIRRVSGFLAGVLMVCLLSGCAGTLSSKLATGAAAKANYDIQIYATDNVPFEYTELGIVRGMSWVDLGHPTEATYMDAVVKEAKSMGADAIINFHLSSTYNSGGFVLVVWANIVEAQGVAVKIKRP